jgi:Tfp pilus assembly protein PilO
MPEIPKLHPRSISFIFICLVGVTAMALLGLLPNHMELKELQAEAQRLRSEIQIQEALAPVVKKLVQKVKPMALEGLQKPPVREATVASMSNLSTQLADLAAQHDLTLEMAAPDERSLADTTGHLVLNLRVSGDFFHFRDFLMDLVQQANLARMETLHIETLNDRRELSSILVFLQAV